MNKKIVHICLGCHFTNGMGYQENHLVSRDLKDNYDVYVITDEFLYDSGVLKPVGEERLFLDGYTLIRLKYKKIINDFIASKIKKVNGLYRILNEVKPDIVFFHGITGVEVLTVAKYKKYNNIKFFIDTHEDKNNSGTNFVSLFFQYKILTYLIIKYINKYVDKYYYVSKECLDFVLKNCGVKESKTQPLYLGGVFYNDQDYINIRSNLRSKYNFDNEIILLVSGKFIKNKKLVELIRCFNELKGFKLIIVGDVQYNNELVLKLIEENKKNILFLGWQTKDELVDIMCCSDVYIQLGTQSASLQQASCLHNMIITYPHDNYLDIYSNSVVYVESIVDLKKTLLNINKENVQYYKEAGFKTATEKLDYDKISKIYKF